MRAARQLARETQLWTLVWQQVEAFADRIDGARDQDRDSAARTHALLLAAKVVEQERGKRVEEAPLGDPVIFDPPRPSLDTGWRADHRIWRLPGTDELELAATQLYHEDPGDSDPDKTRLEVFQPIEYFSYFLDKSDPAHDAATGGKVTVRMPGYPDNREKTLLLDPETPPNLLPANPSTPLGTAEAAGTRRLGAARRTPDIPGDNDAIESLFSYEQRKHATLDTDQDPDEEYQTAWSALTANRRDNRRGAASADVNYYSELGASIAWSSRMATDTRAMAEDVIAGRVPPLGVSHLAIAQDAEAAARGAAATGSDNAEILRAVADRLDQVGRVADGLTGEIRQAADSLHPRPDLFIAVADAAEALQPYLALPLNMPAPADFVTRRTDAARDLREAVDALTATMLTALVPLLNAAPEAGSLAPDLDAAIAERLAYPDGSLRILRALETGFMRYWPARIRWLTFRHALSLARLFAAFRAPFLQGLRALIDGGDTGFPIGGLRLLAATQTRAVKLRLDQPASFAMALPGIEAGHMILTTEGREAAMIILGVTGDEGRLAFDIAPLRVSVESLPGAPEGDQPGMISGGQELTNFLSAPGILTGDLRAGEHATNPLHDGRIETAVILYGQLALLFGWETVEKGLTGGVPSYANRSLPDPVATPLETVTLHGVAPRNVMTIVLKGMGEPFLDLSNPAAPEPRVGRPGELLLIRGRGKPAQEGEVGRMRQSVIAVQRAYAIKAEAFHRMDKTAVALLSPDPLPDGDIDDCLATCKPEDPLIVITLEQTWQSFDLHGDISLRRDFQGFDLPSLATGTLLPASVVEQITGTAPADEDLDRGGEFTAARGILETWTRFAQR